MLAIGLGTRFSAFVLIVLDVVARAGRAGNGYKVCDDGYKLPPMYLTMRVPLLLWGPGKLSAGHAIRARPG